VVSLSNHGRATSPEYPVRESIRFELPLFRPAFTSIRRKPVACRARHFKVIA
jgi:hypothetical protein